jgi:hypothetical protein
MNEEEEKNRNDPVVYNKVALDIQEVSDGHIDLAGLEDLKGLPSLELKKK